ncbi:MAG TPA: CPBP family intramembrane glutamic endopeptidase [Candidatus Limnocylindrales bacterium]|jgi:membrane protease YdiL (CAAX protease family)
MTTAALGRRTTPTALAVLAGGLPAIGLLGGLVVIVGGRWWALMNGLDPLAVGAIFGLALAGLAVIGFRRIATQRAVGLGRRTWIALAIGVGAGLVLVGVTLAGATIAGATLVPGLGRPAAPFVPWAAITIIVATGEEALLRGRLFNAVRHAGGLPAAVLLTTFAFALMHVPLYGWHVVPLDFAVGLSFAGLRLATRGIVAPAAAHAVADLVTWWL